jgi:hypothetical protein
MSTTPPSYTNPLGHGIPLLVVYQPPTYLHLEEWQALDVVLNIGST